MKYGREILISHVLLTKNRFTEYINVSSVCLRLKANRLIRDFDSSIIVLIFRF